ALAGAQLEPVEHRAVRSDGPAHQPVADDVDLEELEGGGGGCRERLGPHWGGLAPSSAGDVGDAVQRHGGFVVVVVAGQHQVDVVADQHRLQVLQEPVGGAVAAR